MTTLYNTYWVRFAHGGIDHSLAVENSRTLFQAAKSCRGTQDRPYLDPSSLPPLPYPYFRGKASSSDLWPRLVLLTRPAAVGALRRRRRPLNNIAWLLRAFPSSAVGGRGSYEVRPTHIDDLPVSPSRQLHWSDDRSVDAVGPERPDLCRVGRADPGCRRQPARASSVSLHHPARNVEGARSAMSDVLLTPTNITRWQRVWPTPRLRQPEQSGVGMAHRTRRQPWCPLCE